VAGSGTAGVGEPPDRESFLAGAVPVASVGAVLDPDVGEEVAAVCLDARDRPEVADLARVHSSEGVGDLRLGLGVWDLGPPTDWLVRLEVVVTRPVACEFFWAMAWESHQAWLDHVASGGVVALGTLAGDGEPGGDWLLMNVAAERLEPVLAALKRRAGTQPGGGVS